MVFFCSLGALIWYRCSRCTLWVACVIDFLVLSFSVGSCLRCGGVFVFSGPWCSGCILWFAFGINIPISRETAPLRVSTVSLKGWGSSSGLPAASISTPLPVAGVEGSGGLAATMPPSPWPDSGHVAASLHHRHAQCAEDGALFVVNLNSRSFEPHPALVAKALASAPSEVLAFMARARSFWPARFWGQRLTPQR